MTSVWFDQAPRVSTRPPQLVDMQPITILVREIEKLQEKFAPYSIFERLNVSKVGME
jgi:hypothetical protein